MQFRGQQVPIAAVLPQQLVVFICIGMRSLHMHSRRYVSQRGVGVTFSAASEGIDGRGGAGTLHGERGGCSWLYLGVGPPCCLVVVCSEGYRLEVYRFAPPCR